MAEVLTKQQKQAVINRGGKLLVSAAAGSGKTKVLVDRLLEYLTDPVKPANIDEFLIITYTKAAAAELRAKIAAKLTERISEQPENRHLQRQIQRLYLTNISTIHSFCGDLLRQYAYMTDLPADFRVADENECQEIQIQVLDQLLEEAYESAASDENFRAFVDSQGFGRDDRQIPEIVLKVYNSARCHLNPEKWLQWCLDSFDISGFADPSETVWGEYLIADLKAYLELQIDALSRCASCAEGSAGMEKPAALLRNTVFQLEQLMACNTWDEIVHHKQIDYGRLTFPKSCTDSNLVEEIKAVRNHCKDGLARKLTAFTDSSQQVMLDLRQVANAARGLVDLVKRFELLYSQRKRSRRVVDFSDLEHRTLDLVLGKNRNVPTALAREIGQRYIEIMIDEYQDTNEVQDQIFAALTAQRDNCFMVGDVKQSIYQFRLADPEIFIKKYNSYVSAEEAQDRQGRKVILSSNFRSAGGVISAVNDVFSSCMSAKIGGIDYTEEEMLYEGIPHVPLNDTEVELYGIQVAADTYEEEAAIVAIRISELLDGKHMVRSGDQLRPITAGDIVILLRSPGSVGEEFRYALENIGIPCTTGTGADLLCTEEISVFRSLLQVISNPVQDIPLLAVLSSRLFCFTADELASIRAARKYVSIYEAVKKSDNPKCIQFMKLLESLRQDARLYSLPQLMQQVLVKLRLDSVYAAMPDGQQKQENIQYFCQIAADYESVSHRGLDQFLEHLTVMESKGVIYSAEKAGNAAVTIMSIHRSKGLEFPVVFLSALSRSFNQESARAQVLCDKDLGLGLCCMDRKNRVRYPSIAKRAISAKIKADGLSEEMRVLYVAMTRPKDRLIMTYAVKNLEADLRDILLRTPHSNKVLLTGDVSSPGEWVLQTALTRTEAGAFFRLAGCQAASKVKEPFWKIAVVEEAPSSSEVKNHTSAEENDIPLGTIEKIRKGLSYRYPHLDATQTPSKLTATQLKGRLKDSEIAEHTKQLSSVHMYKNPSFAQKQVSGIEFGNAVHSIMQYIPFASCSDSDSIRCEIEKLVQSRILTAEQANVVDPERIQRLFSTPLGKQMRECKQVLREFKFSLLDSSERYAPQVQDEEILLQGIVDCALIEDDGITVIDFKTDRVNEYTCAQVAEGYSLQVKAYAEALMRIFKKPVKDAYLYFFSIDRFEQVAL